MKKYGLVSLLSAGILLLDLSQVHAGVKFWKKPKPIIDADSSCTVDPAPGLVQKVNLLDLHVRKVQASAAMDDHDPGIAIEPCCKSIKTGKSLKGEDVVV